MTEQIQGLVEEAKKNRFSTIGPSLSNEDVVHVWDGVSTFIEKQMLIQKGVQISGLGTFTFSQKKLDVGNNKFILIQRPVFLLSEKFAQTHGLKSTKHHVSGQIPVVTLNFAALSFDSPFDRDTVEGCVKEVLGALGRSIAAKRNVEFTFTGIGRLQIRDSKVKMKFYKEFINSMDGSGKLVETMINRPGTVDSVMSDRPASRPNTTTLQLPRITQAGEDLSLDAEKPAVSMPTINEDEEGEEAGEPAADLEVADDLNPAEQEAELADLQGGELQEDAKPINVLASRSGSRLTAPLAKASGICFADDLIPPTQPTPKGMRGSSLAKSSPAPLKRCLSPINDTPRPSSSPGLKAQNVPELQRSHSLGSPAAERAPIGALAPPKPLSPPRTASSCGHPNAGQELCYLCHQRERRNVPSNFTEERKKREYEEDQLLQQYQRVQDSEAILKDQEQKLAKRHDSQKMAAFNLGAAEAIKAKKNARPTDFYPSYVFQKRPLTPPRFLKQERYLGDLEQQVKVKDDSAKKRKSDEEFLERLEQVQLAEDLAAQREQYLRDKHDQREQYKRALSAQLRFKPLPLPAREPDSTHPIFGVNDLNTERMLESRRRAYEVMKEQMETVAQQKREAILKRLTQQKEEETVLECVKENMHNDRASRFKRMFENRRRLEEHWANASELKRSREHEDRQRMMTPGKLLHEQCDKYRRCRQCKRLIENCGESNIWRDTRYIPGSRVMV